MKTIKEIYDENLKTINEMPVITGIAAEIKKITEALATTDLAGWTPDQLSRALTKLAVYRVNLGAEMADAVAYFDVSYTHRKLTYANEWKPAKEKLNAVLQRATVQDIDSYILGKLADEYQAEIKQKHYAEKLRILYDATETLITALQSRLGVLKQERIEAQHGN